MINLKNTHKHIYNLQLHINKLLLIIVVIVSSRNIYGQQNENNCLLWEISGNDLKTPSYIFGTIHLIPASDFFFPTSWEEKLYSTKYLLIETDLKMGIFKQLALIKKMKLPGDSVLSDYMTKKEFKAYQTYMLDSLNISINKYKATLIYKPFFTSAIIIDEIIDEKKIIYEKYLSKKAKKKKIKIKSLEEIDYQINLINKMPIAEQIRLFLFDYTKEHQTNIKKEYYELLEKYKNQDLTSILEISEDLEDINRAETLINERNKNWIPIIEQYINKKSTFIAVGAAHLPGKNGVLQLLRKKGYTVKSVCETKENKP